MRLVPVLGIATAIAALTPDPAQAQSRDLPAASAAGPLADSLRATAHRMVELLRNRDTRGVVELYGDTLNFVHVENGTLIPWPRLSAMMRSYLDSVSVNPIRIVGEPGVTLVDTNNAVLHVTHRFEGDGGGNTHTGVWTGVLHRFREGWKIVHSHSSDGPPSR